jgi:hypothetical protein
MGNDGLEKIQLRVDLGLLQMNIDGRPDGKRPMGHETLLDHFLTKLQDYRNENNGEDEGFRLTPEDCFKLQQEAIQFHHRYISLYQLDDFQKVLDDTDHNLELFEFVSEYAAEEELVSSMDQWRPQLLMLRARSRGMLLLKDVGAPAAIEAVEEGINDLKEFYLEQAHPEWAESSMEVQSLDNWLNELRAGEDPPGKEDLELSEKDRIELEMQDAIDREDYEKAAECRDALAKIKQEL